MAGTDITNVLQDHAEKSMMVQLLRQFNLLVDDVELLRTSYNQHQHAALNAAPSTQTISFNTLKASKVVPHK